MTQGERSFELDMLDYLDDKLSDDERYAVERRWLRDPETRAAAAGFRESGLSTKELSDDLADLRASYAHTSRGTGGRTTALVIVAVLAVLTIWSAWGYYQDQRPARLYAEHFALTQERESYLAVRGEDTEVVGGLGEAIAAYRRQDYRIADRQLRSLREQHPFDSEVLHYAALSALQLGDYYAAETILQQHLSVAADPEDRAVATWYLSLVYVRLGEKNAAAELLQQLMEDEQKLFAGQAEQLLRELGAV